MTTAGDAIELPSGRRDRGSVVDSTPVRRGFDLLWLALGFYFVIQVLWRPPLGIIVQGCIIGGLTALVSFGIALIYRANRIINFAQGDLGAAPATFAILCVVSGPHISYFLALPLAIVLAVVLGGAVEFLIIRRFFKAPRLILTVVTLALIQLFAGLGLILPRLGWFKVRNPNYPAPFKVALHIDPLTFRAHDIVAMLVVPLFIVGLAAFFRFTHIGIAVRASAESAERAALLGVPVKRIQTIVWIIATVMATVALFMRAGIVGLPFGEALGPAILVRALAACVIGRMENLPRIFVGAMALGIIEQSIFFHTGKGIIVAPILFGIVLGALLLQRRGIVSRADAASAWQAAKAVRPLPRELAGVPAVRFSLLALKLAVLAALVVVPTFLPESRINLIAVIMILSIIGLSLVVLTGWAGQVSLGQMAFVGLGGAIAGSLTTRLGWDLSIALVCAGVMGALIAVVIGLPALRIKGLFLAVTTLSFALATEQYLLNEQFFGWWLPSGRIARTPLFGVISVESETRYYYFTFAVLLGALGVVRGVRNSRTGRVLIGVRENERAAESYGVNAVGAKLTAFAISGFLAAFAGGLFVHHQQALDITSFKAQESLGAFVSVVIGGLGSPAGAILGAVFQRGISYFVPQLRFFTQGLGLVVILMLIPGGLGSVIYQVRDAMLRWYAKRKGIVVPSLLADSRDATVQLSSDRGFDFEAMAAGGQEMPFEEPQHDALVFAPPADDDDELVGAGVNGNGRGEATSNGRTKRAPAKKAAAKKAPARKAAGKKAPAKTGARS